MNAAFNFDSIKVIQAFLSQIGYSNDMYHGCMITQIIMYLYERSEEPGSQFHSASKIKEWIGSDKSESAIRGYLNDVTKTGLIKRTKVGKKGAASEYQVNHNLIRICIFFSQKSQTQILRLRLEKQTQILRLRTDWLSGICKTNADSAVNEYVLNAESAFVFDENIFTTPKEGEKAPKIKTNAESATSVLYSILDSTIHNSLPTADNADAKEKTYKKENADSTASVPDAGSHQVKKSYPVQAKKPSDKLRELLLGSEPKDDVVSYYTFADMSRDIRSMVKAEPDKLISLSGKEINHDVLEHAGEKMIDYMARKPAFTRRFTNVDAIREYFSTFWLRNQTVPAGHSFLNRDRFVAGIEMYRDQEDAIQVVKDRAVLILANIDSFYGWVKELKAHIESKDVAKMMILPATEDFVKMSLAYTNKGQRKNLFTAIDEVDQLRRYKKYTHMVVAIEEAYTQIFTATKT